MTRLKNLSRHRVHSSAYKYRAWRGFLVRVSYALPVSGATHTQAQWRAYMVAGRAKLNKGLSLSS